MSVRQEVAGAWENVLSPLFEEFSEEVLVQSVDEAATQIDPLYDEPVQTKEFTDPVAIRARVKLERERAVLPGGEEIDIDGRVTVRTEEVTAAGITLDVGSRITIRGNRYTAVHQEGRADLGGQPLLTRVMIEREIA